MNSFVYQAFSKGLPNKSELRTPKPLSGFGARSLRRYGASEALFSTNGEESTFSFSLIKLRMVNM